MFEGKKNQFNAPSGEITPTTVYRERFATEAEQYNNKWYVWLGLSTPKTAEDTAHESALLDNEDFDYRQTPEYKKWEKRNEAVFAELKEKRDKPASETEHIRPLILFCGGAMLGAVGAAQAELLRQAGLDKSFTTVLGNSAGSGTAAYFVAGGEQTKIAASLFANECTTKEFLGFKPDKPGQYLDATVIATAMRTGEKALDESAIRNSKTELFVIATNRNTGATEFLDMKNTNDGVDMVTKLEASSAITMFRDPVVINDTPYCDGTYSQISIEEIITRFNPTSILIIPNESFKPRHDIIKEGVVSAVTGLLKSATKKARQHILGSAGSLSEIENYLQMRENEGDFMDELHNSTGTHIGVMWAPPTKMTAVNNNPVDVRHSLLDTYVDAALQLGMQPQDTTFA